MAHWLAPRESAKQIGHVKRFDARFWTVNFPRPMMASVVTTGPNALRVDAVFHHANELAGLIWEAEDRHDHPLTAYETSRDFRQCVLSFRWRSGGLKPLDDLHGPTLTIEGRDSGGNARSWFVRLWNYAQGSPEDATVRLDFSLLAGGWEADDPVFAGDVDRMFVSLAPPGYDESATPFAEPAEGWAELSAIACEGAGSVLSIGETLVPEHRLRIATGYDDLYHVTPERLLRNVLGLGYRGPINHYVGMSHYFRLRSDGKVAGGLNGPCVAWHRDFAERAKALGYELILSLSYELLDMHCPEGWKQRAADGSPALTGWEPPSALLSPANAEAMTWLQGAARAFVAIARDAGLRVRFQVGEPWWWVRSDGTICIYDDAAKAAFDPVPIGDVRGPLDEAQKATLDAAGDVLAASTATLCDAVRIEPVGAETLLLVYLPTVLPERQHYFAGFVLKAEDKAQWRAIAEAAERSGAADVFVWALPQVLRDGFTWSEIGDDEMQAFEDVRFPISIGREASMETGFSTAIVTTANGFEQRNSDWADARMRFDAGPGVRSEAELRTLVEFFRARRGAAVGFRFEDPFDHEAEQELLGLGDGIRTDFPLVKHYGGQVRRITRPVAGSVRVFVDGVERSAAWTLGGKGRIVFEAAPETGAEVRASFGFDVPVRFAEDRLNLSRATFEAGEAASVPLIEVREDAV